MENKTIISADIEAYVLSAAKSAFQVKREFSQATTAMKNDALRLIAAAIGDRKTAILDANRNDLGNAVNIDPALLERLALTEKRVSEMINGILSVVELPDPVGTISHLGRRPSGIEVGRMRVPLGMIGIIYEARPAVTADVSALAIKSGNVALLKGGSEAQFSNQVIASCVREGLGAAGLPVSGIICLDTTDRRAVGTMLKLNQYIDVIVPRGGKGLCRRVATEATMPSIKHLDGVCHVYLDDSAEVDKAIAIAINAKTQRYGTCNTMETLLATPAAASRIFPKLIEEYALRGVELRGCSRTCEFSVSVIEVTEEDWYTEYLAPILSIKIVSDIDEAMEHIAKYGSGHSEAIVTENLSSAKKFLNEVDSSSVMVNASTRFADGFEYGLGAEMGISTDKFHARGPVGLEGLTSEKWVVIGDGQIRE
jgi:glutamate-5-semialdehyde dehydrogenase